MKDPINLLKADKKLQKQYNKWKQAGNKPISDFNFDLEIVKGPNLKIVKGPFNGLELKTLNEDPLVEITTDKKQLWVNDKLIWEADQDE